MDKERSEGEDPQVEEAAPLDEDVLGMVSGGQSPYSEHMNFTYN